MNYNETDVDDDDCAERYNPLASRYYTDEDEQELDWCDIAEDELTDDEIVDADDTLADSRNRANQLDAGFDSVDDDDDEYHEYD